MSTALFASGLIGVRALEANADTVTLTPPFDGCSPSQCTSVEGTSPLVDLKSGDVAAVAPPDASSEGAIHVVFAGLAHAVSNLRLRVTIHVSSAENGGQVFMRTCSGVPCEPRVDYPDTVYVGAGVGIDYVGPPFGPVYPWVAPPKTGTGTTPPNSRNAAAGTVVQLWTGVRADVGQAIAGSVQKIEMLSDPPIPPDTAMYGGPWLYTSSRSATFSFAATPDDPGDTFECKLDDAAFTTCPRTVTYDNLAEGSHTISARTVDYAGVADPTPASYTWTVDLTPPDAPTITSGPQGTTNAHPTWSFETNERSRFECWVDDADFKNCSSPFGVNPLPEGAHTFRVQATDLAGNIGQVTSQSWIQDTTPPDTTITAGPSSLANRSAATFAFTSTEGGSTFACSLDGVDFTTCESPLSYASLADGQHTFAVRATDIAGNTDPTAASSIWTIDTTPPDTTITSGPAGETASTTASFAFTSNETGAGFTCSLDGAAFSACSSPVTYPSLATGQHTFRVASTDAAGNTDATPASQTWFIGLNHAPRAVGDSLTTNENTAKTISVLANDSDPDGDALSVTAVGRPAHGKAARNADGTLTYTPATNYYGPDSFEYTISDGRGGTSSANVSVNVIHVNQPPVAVNDTARTTRSTRVTINVLANDSDPDNDALRVTSIGSFTKGGSATINTDQTVRYRPPTGFVGTESFVYRISDGHGHTASAKVTVTVSRP